jgi:hypothetical protein
MSDSILNQLDVFMASNSRNLWLSDDVLSIYVRKSKRIYHGLMLDMMDVANISSINPEYEHQGYFKQFMMKVESLGLPVFVESISSTNTNLLNILTKNGYNILPNPQGVHNAIKFPQKA